MMGAVRKNTIVVDVSVLPSRPEIGKIKKFLDDELRVDITQLKSIQLYNVRNQVFLEMGTIEEADQFAADHHMMHAMEHDGKQYTIPIFVNDNAVDVRIHDLPTQMDNGHIEQQMRRYGEVLSIRNDVWKNFFPGIPNGVRIVRMKLKHPIPSFITIENEATLVTYRGQTRTCRNCGHRAHSGLRCSEISKQQQQNITEQRDNATRTFATVVQDASNEASNQQQTKQQWATSPSPLAFHGFPDATTAEEKSSMEEDSSAASRTDLADTANIKRQRSTDTESIKPGPKKPVPSRTTRLLEAANRITQCPAMSMIPRVTDAPAWNGRPIRRKSERQ